MDVSGKRQDPKALVSGKSGKTCKETWQWPRAGQKWCEKSRLHRSLNPEPPISLQVAIPKKLSRGIGEPSQVN